MAGYNRTVLVGNLTRDPEHKQLTSGQSVCRLGLAVNRQYKNRQSGEFVQEVCFIDIDVWGAQAESCKQYLQKGRQVLIEGRLKLDTWEDQNGQTRSKHLVVADRVVFLSNAQSDEVQTSSSQFSQDQQSDLEKELMDQLDQIKAKEEKKAKPATKTPLKKENVEEQAETDASTGGIDFKDEQPFTDDLPF